MEVALEKLDLRSHDIAADEQVALMPEVINSMAGRIPERVVCLDECLVGND